MKIKKYSIAVISILLLLLTVSCIQIKYHKLNDMYVDIKTDTENTIIKGFNKSNDLDKVTEKLINKYSITDIIKSTLHMNSLKKISKNRIPTKVQEEIKKEIK